MSYLLGIDIGTTNTKAVVYDPSRGQVVAVASRPTVTHHPRPEWSEYDPAELWRGVVEVVREAAAGRAADIRAVGVASMAEAGVPIDGQGRYLYPIICWHDPRSEPQSRRWHEWLGAQRVFEITGQPIQVKFTVNKLLWLKDHAPEVWRAMRKWLCIQDFALWKLTGAYATDYTVASRTMAFDQRARTWSEEILCRVGLPADVFADLRPSGTAVGRVTREAAAETGLVEGTVVATGGHDHLCGAFAAGTLGPGTLLNSLGTAEACLLLTDDYRPDERLLRGGYSHYAYVVPGSYVLTFSLSASGGLLDWFVRQLAPEAAAAGADRRLAFDTLLAAAETVAPGSEGLFWLPHLNGSGSPWFDELSRASMIGLMPAHSRAHMVRALLEGLSYWMRENLDTLVEVAGAPASGEVVAIGGGSRAALWMQIKADVTGRPVRVAQVPEAVAVGAALLAGLGAGVFKSHAEAAGTVVQASTVYQPDPARGAAYQSYYRSIYCELYPALRGLNHRIHEVFVGRS